MNDRFRGSSQNLRGGFGINWWRDRSISFGGLICGLIAGDPKICWNLLESNFPYSPSWSSAWIALMRTYWPELALEFAMARTVAYLLTRMTHWPGVFVNSNKSWIVFRPSAIPFSSKTWVVVIDFVPMYSVLVVWMSLQFNSRATAAALAWHLSMLPAQAPFSVAGYQKYKIIAQFT
jgi:hypothetical protein